MKGAFCLTGRMGMVRNLTAERSSVRFECSRRTGHARQALNIVLMGMGEPLHIMTRE